VCPRLSSISTIPPTPPETCTLSLHDALPISEWAAKSGMNLQSSTLKFDEGGKPFHIQQAEQIRLYREAWKAAGHAREPRVSVSRDRKSTRLNSSHEWISYGGFCLIKQYSEIL